MKMIHRDCGGRLHLDFANSYKFTGEDAEQFGSEVPRLMCKKCGEEVLGDSMVVLVDDNGVEIDR